MMYKAPFSRTRGNLSTQYLNYSYTRTKTFQGKPTEVSTVASAVVVPVPIGEQMRDVVTPGYKELVAKGRFINNPCHRNENDVSIEPFSGLTYQATYYGSTPSTGTLLTDKIEYFDRIPDPSTSFPFVPIPDKHYRAIQAANEAAASSRQRDVLGMVDLAEARKTMDLIKTNLGRLDVVLNQSKPRGVKVGRKRKATFYKPKSKMARIADKAGLWLEAHYGLLPLMMSINGLISALDKNVRRQTSPQTFRGSDRLADKLSSTNTSYVPLTSGSGNILRIDYVTEVEFYQKARAGLISSYQPDLFGRLGMELSDIPTTIQELIPYSFVVDWFWDIGTYIDALMSSLTVPRQHVFESVYQEVATTWRLKFYEAAYQNTTTKYNYYAPAWECAMTATERSYDRTPTLSVGLPQPDFHLKSLTHLVSGISLVLSNAKTRALARI